MAMIESASPPARSLSSHDMLVELSQHGIRDPSVLAAMACVPRQAFSPSSELDGPFVIAWMLQALQLRHVDRALEIGRGTGYTTAVLSELSHHVDRIEARPWFAAALQARLQHLGYHTVEVHCGDPAAGWVAHAPYDAIVVTVPGPSIPDALITQLADGGRLVMPVIDATTRVAHVVRVSKLGDEKVVVDLGPVARLAA